MHFNYYRAMILAQLNESICLVEPPSDKKAEDFSVSDVCKLLNLMPSEDLDSDPVQEPIICNSKIRGHNYPWHFKQNRRVK